MPRPNDMPNADPKYWNNKGAHQREYERLFAELVPDEGPAATNAGEALRCMSRIYYDRFNNGNGNKRVLLPLRRTLWDMRHNLMDVAEANGIERRKMHDTLKTFCNMTGGAYTHAVASDLVADVVVLFALQETNRVQAQ